MRAAPAPVAGSQHDASAAAAPSFFSAWVRTFGPGAVPLRPPPRRLFKRSCAVPSQCDLHLVTDPYEKLTGFSTNLTLNPGTNFPRKS